MYNFPLLFVAEILTSQSRTSVRSCHVKNSRLD